MTGSSWGWRPTLADVSALLQARVAGQTGDPATGTPPSEVFTAETHPTAQQVERLIDLYVGEVAGTFERMLCAEELVAAAGTVATYGAAALVELTFWPEEANIEGSIYRRLVEQRDASWERLERRARQICDFVVGFDSAAPDRELFAVQADWPRGVGVP